jgi:hypothetical protein
MKETVKYLRETAQSGRENPPLPEGIKGWWTQDSHYICAKCAARIIDQGCRLPKKSEPVFFGSKEYCGICCVCDSS